jgi:uridine kinase|tara:strand:- start:297 stop:1097 length:801 start_codon:yes stop_codon:yes gene_type:complete
VNTLYALRIFGTGHKSCFIKQKHYKFASLSEAKEINRVFFAIVIYLTMFPSVWARTLVTRTIIAIAGASASGKSLFSKTIYNELVNELEPGAIAVIEEDAYYKDQSHLPFDHRTQTNYDHPDAFEHELLHEHLLQLRAGKSVDVPTYDYAMHTRSDETRRVAPAKVLIVEGILLLSDPALRKEFDIKVFIDTPLDICLMRRMQRDMEQRGRTLQSVVDQYQATVRPMFYQFIEPSKHKADLVVTRGGMNRVAIDIIKSKIKYLLQQ